MYFVVMNTMYLMSGAGAGMQVLFVDTQATYKIQNGVVSRYDKSNRHIYAIVIYICNRHIYIYVVKWHLWK